MLLPLVNVEITSCEIYVPNWIFFFMLIRDTVLKNNMKRIWNSLCSNQSTKEIQTIIWACDPKE